jgi:DNA helicase-2/ATP-dependent DNA helicase PcrA
MTHRSRLLDSLNPAQRAAAEAIQGPVAIIAGAGSGKTRVITHRIAWMIAQGIPGSQILAVTFTNKAAREMRERVERLVGSGTSRVSTFHSFCSSFLREEFGELGREKEFSIYDDGDSIAVVKRVLEELNLDPTHTKPEAARRQIGRWKNSGKSPEDLKQLRMSAVESHLLQVYERYEAELEKSNACDFDDLLLKTAHLLKTKEHVLRRWHERITHVLVDEFQDTNLVQYEICRALTAHTHHLCVTGDQDQGIYSWRGADANGFERFLGDHPTAQTFLLEQNYRSSGRILRAATSLIAHNRNRIHKRLWTESAEGEPVRVIEAFDDEQEALGIADNIQSLARSGVPLGSMAVFFRTNALSLPIERALAAKGIPYVMVGGLEFFARQEVKDLLAWLRFLSNPKDLISLLRIINVPTRGLGDKTVKDLLSVAREQARPLGELLSGAFPFEGFPPRARTAINGFQDILQRTLALRDGPVASFVNAVIKESGYGDYWKTKADKDGSRDPYQNLGQLLNFASDFDDTHGTGLSEFLTMVALMTDHDRSGPNSDAVSLMTLHVSKGLEFDTVFILGAEEELLPHSMSSGSQESLEEERRLLHVGMTRAMRRLSLSQAYLRSRFGRRQPTIPSRFLRELGDVVTESRGDSAPLSPDAHSRGFSNTDDDDEVDYDHPLAFLRQGHRVWHPDWGRGVVQALRGRGHPLDRKGLVRFDDGSVREVILRHSSLELLEEMD